MTSLDQSVATTHDDIPFRGLAPFLRLSIAGVDLRPVGQAMLERAGSGHENAELWLTLANVMLAMGLRDAGLAIQSQALTMQRAYHIAATEQPAKVRLLMLMVPGDLSANTPLECLLEKSDIELIFYYLSPETLFAEPLPEHDLLMVAISEADEHRQFLDALVPVLANWPKPVINAPQHIPATGRDVASELLQNVPGLLMPPTMRATRQQLQTIANGLAAVPELFTGCDFPIIVRPVGSHAGRDLDKMTGKDELAAYLSRVQDENFFISRFIDYSGKDGLFRKYRIALINGEPFACHMAISSNWMIHYLNAGMYEDAQKRAEEGAFMAHFDEFAARHRSALAAIHQRTGLDYVCIDCADTQGGQLLVFEIDHAMIVHAMDSEALFPYKQLYMRKVSDAFREFLFGLMPTAALPEAGTGSDER